MNNWMIFIFVIIFGCNDKNDLDSELLNKLTDGANKGIIISCLRCNCIDEALSINKDLVTTVDVFCSEKCSLKFDWLITKNIHQSSIDSIYADNYNIILFKKKKNKYSWRLLRTEEVVKFSSIFINFFK